MHAISALGCGDHVLAEQFARVRRAMVGVAAHYRPLMILLKVQDIGIATPELEGGAGWIVALHAVKVETGKVYVLWGGCGVKNIKPPQDALVHRYVNLGLACFPTDSLCSKTQYNL